jgi:uncharacterized protein (TIGR02996 family)
MHPEADAFLDAIFTHPDDDTPRLVYADWLQEHGQENYARFIRLQCAAAREKLWSDEANRLWEEIGRVWNRLDGEWWPATREAWEVPALIGKWDSHTSRMIYRMGRRAGWLDAVHFERGFLRPSVPVTAELLLHLAAHDSPIGFGTLFLITADNAALESVAELPALRWVTRVECPSSWAAWGYHEPRSDALNEFLCSVHLRRVKTLDLSKYWLMQENVPVLLNAPNLASVEELHVRFGEDPACEPEETVLLLRSRFKRVIRS